MVGLLFMRSFRLLFSQSHRYQCIDRWTDLVHRPLDWSGARISGLYHLLGNGSIQLYSIIWINYMDIWNFVRDVVASCGPLIIFVLFRYRLLLWSIYQSIAVYYNRLFEIYKFSSRTPWPYHPIDSVISICVAQPLHGIGLYLWYSVLLSKVFRQGVICI